MKILLIDDHALFRAGLRMLLTSIDTSATILEASTTVEALALIGTHPDLRLCLLDLNLKEEDGLEALLQIKAAAPDVAVVVVSSSDDITTVYRCLDAGAMSFVPKSFAPEVLTEAMRQVLSGAVYLPDEVLAATNSRAAPPPNLTPRQLQVLQGLRQGLPTKSIATKLQISEHTANEHIATIFRTLGVHSRTQAVVAAGRFGLPFDR